VGTPGRGLGGLPGPAPAAGQMAKLRTSLTRKRQHGQNATFHNLANCVTGTYKCKRPARGVARRWEAGCDSDVRAYITAHCESYRKCRETPNIQSRRVDGQHQHRAIQALLGDLSSGPAPRVYRGGRDSGGRPRKQPWAVLGSGRQLLVSLDSVRDGTGATSHRPATIHRVPLGASFNIFKSGSLPRSGRVRPR